MITVVGIGMESGDITARGRKAIRQAAELYSRTKTRFKSTPLGENSPTRKVTKNSTRKSRNFFSNVKKTASQRFFCRRATDSATEL